MICELPCPTVENLHGPGCLCLIIDDLFMYMYSEQQQKAMATGININPYICENSLASANATIATEMEESVTDMCSQARKVRSLAKKTFGSTFVGTFLVLVFVMA